MSFFLLSALRAVIEMLLWCLLGQGVLYVMAGQGRGGNRIYQLFDLITGPPRRLIAVILRGATNQTIGLACFAILLVLWLGLAFVRKYI